MIWKEIVLKDLTALVIDKDTIHYFLHFKYTNSSSTEL